MKTYSGELKDGMPFKGTLITEHGEVLDWGIYEWFDGCKSIPDQVYHDNEWQLYKPTVKKVWGIPGLCKMFYTVAQKTDRTGDYVVNEWRHNNGEIVTPMFLSKEHAEQHAKALNMANEFRLLSDVPVDGVRMYFITNTGEVTWQNDIKYLDGALFGVIVYEGRQHELESWRRKIHIASKIIQFGFHGIVEERL